MRNLTVALSSMLFAGLACAQPSPVAQEKRGTRESLKAEIEALKAAKPAWREIAWKSCLLEGLKESPASLQQPGTAGPRQDRRTTWNSRPLSGCASFFLLVGMERHACLVMALTNRPGRLFYPLIYSTWRAASAFQDPRFCARYCFRKSKCRAGKVGWR